MVWLSDRTCQYIISCIVHYTFNNTFLGWNSNFVVDACDIESRRIVGFQYRMHRFVDELCYCTLTCFSYPVTICFKNGSFLHQESYEVKVTILRFCWFILNWCGIQRSNFLVKFNASNHLSTIVRWILKISASTGTVRFGLFLMAWSRITFPTSKACMHLV